MVIFHSYVISLMAIEIVDFSHEKWYNQSPQQPPPAFDRTLRRLRCFQLPLDFVGSRRSHGQSHDVPWSHGPSRCANWWKALLMDIFHGLSIAFLWIYLYISIFIYVYIYIYNIYIYIHIHIYIYRRQFSQSSCREYLQGQRCRCVPVKPTNQSPAMEHLELPIGILATGIHWYPLAI